MGYLDDGNYWLVPANKDADDYELWQVSGGTFTKRRNGGTVGAGTHSFSVEVRSGSIEQFTFRGRTKTSPEPRSPRGWPSPSGKSPKAAAIPPVSPTCRAPRWGR